MSISRLAKSVSNAGKGGKAVQITRKVGPVSTLDMGKFAALRGVSVSERKTHMNVLEKVSTFDQLRIHPLVKSEIRSNILKSPTMPPTPVQKVAIKALMRQNLAASAFRSWLIAAETGSGKTLAYLIPMITKLLESSSSSSSTTSTSMHESEEVQHETQRRTPAIRSMVMVPTVELAEQVADTIAKSVPANLLRVGIFAGAQNMVSSLAKQVINGVDIAVGTPDKMLKLQKMHPILMQRALESCSMLVIDEADSLLNDSFEPSTSALIAKCLDLSDLLFVTATIPRKFDKILREKYSQTIRLATPSIHRLPRHIEFRVVEVWHRPYNNNKQLALQQALYSIYHDKTEEGKVKRVVVFVNLKKDVDAVVNMLRQAGYDATGLAADRSNLAEFVQPQQNSTGNSAQKMKVLVATDLVARGVDFQRVRNIILYDMPPSSADLLHRAGRTGRLGTKGRVLLLVSKKESKGWIRGLETIVKKGMALA